MSEKKKHKKTFDLIEILWKIIAPLFLALLRSLWELYGEQFIALFHKAFF